MDITRFVAAFNDGSLLIDTKGHHGVPAGARPLNEQPTWMKLMLKSEQTVGMMNKMVDIWGSLPAAIQEGMLPAILSTYDMCDCGERGGFVLKGQGLECKTACRYADGVPPYTVDLNVPSGRLVFADDLRPLVDANTVGVGMNRHRERKELAEIYAAAGLAFIETGDFFTELCRANSGLLHVVVRGEKKVHSFGAPMGRVAADLHWCSAMDFDAYTAACARFKVDPDDAFQNILVVDVEPGLWRISSKSHTLPEYPRKAAVCSEWRRVGDALPVAPVPGVPSASAAQTFEESPLAALMAQYGGRLDHRLHHFLMMYGHGLEFWNGSLTQREVLEPDNRFAANALAKKIKTNLLGGANFQAVPAWPRADFMAKDHVVKVMGTFYGMSSEYSSIFKMPRKVDIWMLGAALIFFKAVQARQDLLQPLEPNAPKDWPAQTVLVEQALHLLCTLAEIEKHWPRLHTEIFPQICAAILAEPR